MSHPTRVCGLKRNMSTGNQLIIDLVTPHAGVWIETVIHDIERGAERVTPHAGVWIETPHKLTYNAVDIRSHPTRVCGLKPDQTLRQYWKVLVTPHAGVWIETRPNVKAILESIGHTPRGCVD